MRYFHANSPVFIITAFLVYQPDMFKVPHLPSRSEKFLYDPKASHNLFYKNVYCKIPENPFSVVITTQRKHSVHCDRILLFLEPFRL